MNTPEQVQMTNPPKDQTKMTAPAKKDKVRIRLVRAVSFSKKAGGHVLYDAGTVIDVTENTAKQLCDIVLKAQYNFGGERLKANAERFSIVRAVRAPTEELTIRKFQEQLPGSEEGKLELAE